MTPEDIKTMLDKTGYPVAYGYFSDPQPMPYILFRSAYSHNFCADGVVYSTGTRYQLELYTQWKDPYAEDRVENALPSLCWEKSETYIDTERCYQIIYEIEV